MLGPTTTADAFDRKGTCKDSWSCAELDGTNRREGDETGTLPITQAGETFAVDLHADTLRLRDILTGRRLCGRRGRKNEDAVVDAMAVTDFLRLDGPNPTFLSDGRAAGGVVTHGRA